MVHKNNVYLIKDVVAEKTAEVVDKEEATHGVRHYIPGGWRNKTRELTRHACEKDRVFCLIGAGVPQAERNYFELGRLFAFRGISGNDLAIYWHMLVIANLTTTQSHGGCQGLRWVFDLTRSDVPLLMEMKARSLVFLAQNREAFAATYGTAPISRAMKSDIQFGFHTTPSIGYLHLHVLLGPLTVFGSSCDSRGKWIALDEVLDILMVEESMAKYQYQTEWSHDGYLYRDATVVPPGPSS
jgi:hypothetical protein